MWRVLLAYVAKEIDEPGSDSQVEFECQDYAFGHLAQRNLRPLNALDRVEGFFVGVRLTNVRTHPPHGQINGSRGWQLPTSRG